MDDKSRTSAQQWQFQFPCFRSNSPLLVAELLEFGSSFNATWFSWCDSGTAVVVSIFWSRGTPLELKAPILTKLTAIFRIISIKKKTKSVKIKNYSN